MAQTNTRNPNYEQTQKHSTDKEISLLAIIQENSQLPENMAQTNTRNPNYEQRTAAISAIVAQV